MFKRQTTGSVVCPKCGRLVGVNDERCFGCGKWRPGLWGFMPLLGRLGRDLGFTEIVIGGCAVLYVISLLLAPRQIGMVLPFGILAPGREPLFLLGMSGAIPVFGAGRWWTFLSAAWLHGNLLHIVFNMLWIRHLAPAAADLYGTSRLVIIYTVSSITGFALTSFVWLFLPEGLLAGAPFSVGASAPLFGLFGALYLYGQRTGNRMISRQMTQYMVILVGIGVMASFGLMGAIRIDNWAHLGGFGGGYLIARWLDPLRQERPEHSIAALVCIAATVVSIIASVVHGLQFVR